jgi:prephenate dehydrogenase
VTEPPFTRILIVGLGLMGGSTALAIRERWPGVTTVGVDRADVIAEAQAAGAIDTGATDIASALRDAALKDRGSQDAGPQKAGSQDGAHRDSTILVLLAAPVLQNIACLAEIATAKTPLLVSDLSSTKQAIVQAARALPDHITFLGGHPMAGAARGGFAHARADLFRGRPWILTPDTSDAGGRSVSLPGGGPLPGAALSRLQGFVSALGAEPVVMDAAEHDRVMAYVSHLPQIVASGLMRTIGPRVGADGLAVSGQGLADSTRLASSPAGVWTEICQTNAAPLGAALDALIADLQQVRGQLAVPEKMATWLESGARWRSELPNANGSANGATGANSATSVANNAQVKAHE